MYKDELLSIVSNYTEHQLNLYIQELENRQGDTYLLLKELKTLRKRKFSPKKNLDTGQRGGQ